ncbi:MAG: type I-E CRISPR-associated protein Cas7/Cse4/CasC [Chloroflexi bacterium]|nr:type I-E CRISPR-associated protein Cas7/Cse4/CasC [Chloroflexota bacterium]
MPLHRFLQIHTLHSYPAALLNRDDSGLAKRLTYGGTVRTRISSQCLKRHWRMADDIYSLRRIDATRHALRSREIVTSRVIQPLRETGRVSDAVLTAVEEEFQKGVYGESGTSRSGRQPLLLGLPEVEFLRDRAAAICTGYPHDPETAREAAANVFSNKRTNDQRENFRAFRETTSLPGGIVGALFGRMVTSDPAANIDAAVHVAHAFTVHPEESESDYFSVVDDLQPSDDEPGAAHIGDMELTAGLFYGYVVVDVPGLVSNLTGCKSEEWQHSDRTLACTIVEHLIHLIATVSPGAKLGSTAPYAYADLMLVEAGSRQPRSLAGAFRSAVSARADAAATVAAHLTKLDAAYGSHESRRVMCLDPFEFPDAERLALDDLGRWAAQVIRDGTAH